MSSGGALDDITTCDSIAEELMRVIDANLPLHPDYDFDLSDNKKAGGICRRQPCSGEKKYRNTINTWNEIELYISYFRDYDYSAAEKITIKDKTITFNEGNTEQSRILCDWELADLNRLLQHINLNGTYLYDWSMKIKIDLNAAKLVVDGKLIFDVHDVRLGINSHYFIYDYIKCISPVRVSTFD